MLELALSFGSSSSDAERGFSSVVNVKTKKRNRMGHKLLNFLVWFNMNVSYEIEEFPALFYSRLWRQLKHLLVDDPTPPTKRHLKMNTFMIILKPKEGIEWGINCSTSWYGLI